MTKTILAARLAALIPELAKDSLLNREATIFAMLGELECEDKKRLDWLNTVDGMDWLSRCDYREATRQAIDAAMTK